MKISKVLICAGLIGLAFSFALMLSPLMLDYRSDFVLAHVFLLFSLFCFLFIGIGRMAPIVIEKYRANREKKRAAYGELLDRYQKSSAAQRVVPNSESAIEDF